MTPHRLCPGKTHTKREAACCCPELAMAEAEAEARGYRRAIEEAEGRIARMLDGSIVHRIHVGRNGVYVHADDLLSDIRALAAKREGK